MSAFLSVIALIALTSAKAEPSHNGGEKIDSSHIKREAKHMLAAASSEDYSIERIDTNNVSSNKSGTKKYTITSDQLLRESQYVAHDRSILPPRLLLAIQIISGSMATALTQGYFMMDKSEYRDEILISAIASGALFVFVLSVDL